MEKTAVKFNLEVTASYLMDPAHTHITDRAINLVKAQGDQTGTPRRFEYGHDLKGIVRTVDASHVKTRLYGYGKGLPLDEEGNETGGYGRRIDFKDINNGKPYVEDPQATALWGVPGPAVSTLGANLIAGGGFERTYGAGWLLSPSTAFLDALVKKDGDIAPCEGKVMLRMGTDTDTCATSAICDPTKVKGGREYQLTMWTHGTASATVSLKVSQNVTVYPTSDIVLTPPANMGRWTKTTRRFTTHAKCDSIRIRVENPTGTVYVDDISLMEVATTSVHPAEGIYENGDCEDKAQLLAETKAELKRRSTPAISYEADVLTLARSGMDTHNVALGDHVLLVDTTFTPDLRLSGRVLQLEEDLLDPALTVITIGNIIERFTTSSRNTQQRLDRVIADIGAWQSTSQQVAQNASKWDQVAQTVVDNTSRWNDATNTVETNASRWEATTNTVNGRIADWNNAAATLQAKQDAWDRTREALDARQPDWDATTASVAEKSSTWDNAAVTAASHAQAIRQSTTGGVTIHHDQLAITLGETIGLTDENGTTWTFANGAFIKQASTE